MFGLFKDKVLDEDLAVNKVALAITELLSDDSLLDYSKFESTSPFSVTIKEDSNTAKRFYLKKLELITSVAATLLLKEDQELLLSSVTDHVRELVKDQLGITLPVSSKQLSAVAFEISKMRFADPPKIAGERIEMAFTQEVFGVSASNVDAKYLLYKQLSGLERSAIFRIGDAIRSSKS